jgi:hypothetical protein
MSAASGVPSFSTLRVLTRAGAIALQRIPRFPYWTPTDRVNWTTAAFEMP